MELEEGMGRKIAASLAAVIAFIVLILGIGATYYDGSLGSTGGLALVGSIALFVVVMGAVGLWLSE